MTEFRYLFLFFFTWLSIGCSAIGKEDPTPTPTLAPATPVPTQISSNNMAVILVSEGQFLNAHLEPNEESAVVETLPATAIQIPRTGQEESETEVLWAEVQASTTEASWVHAHYLTEYVPPADFCLDSRVQLLLDNLKFALESDDEALFASLVSPAHGLDLRYYRYGTLANYTREEAEWAFSSEYTLNWGHEPGSGDEKIGTFSEIPLPMLKEVFSANYVLYCNDPGTAATFAPEPWPYEYTNINYYQVFKPGTEEYANMDWRSWLVGIEYVEGEPYLFALILFQWTP